MPWLAISSILGKVIYFPHICSIQPAQELLISFPHYFYKSFLVLAKSNWQLSIREFFSI
jgi:hypothetical protein